MMFDRRQMGKIRVQMQQRWPRALVRELNKASSRLGPYGVKIAKALVQVVSGETQSLIKYEAGVDRNPRGNYYQLRIFIDSDASVNPRNAAIKAFVTEFGRGHGRAGARARGSLPPRPFLRPSRELVAKRASGAFQRAMRTAARQTFSQ